MNTILLTGNTRVFPADALSYFNTAQSVFVADRNREGDKAKAPDNIRFFSVNSSDSDFAKIFEAGRISSVWYISRCTDGGKTVDETDRIEAVLQCCARYGVRRMIVVTELTDPVDYRHLIGKWSRPENGMQSVGLAVVCVPLMTGTDTKRSRLGHIFRVMKKKKTLSLRGEAGSPVAILTLRELCSLLLRMTSETWFRPGIYSATGNVTSLENLREVLMSCRPDGQIEFTGPESGRNSGELRSSAAVRLPSLEKSGLDGRLEEMYSLPVMIDWKEDITLQYSRMVDESTEALPFKEKVSACLGRFGWFATTILDLVIMFVIAEFLARITSDSVYFKIVDVRLLYVVLMGMMHGLAAGTTAAVLECVMLVIRYSEIGISGLLLFYNVENWIPFVYYLTTGVICGYTHRKNQQKMRFVSAENELIRNKYLFLNDAYRTSVRDKNELRAQVLSEDESYRKLYEAVRSMAQRTPEAVCVEAVQVLRKLLDNGTVCIYQVDKRGERAQLLSCCLENATRNQIRIADFPEMIKALEKGGTWRNTGFLEGAPMYAELVSFDRFLEEKNNVSNRITLLVTVEQAAPEQLSLWYINHFSILCGLLQEALENASLRERVYK